MTKEQTKQGWAHVKAVGCATPRLDVSPRLESSGGNQIALAEEKSLARSFALQESLQRSSVPRVRPRPLESSPSPPFVAAWPIYPSECSPPATITDRQHKQVRACERSKGPYGWNDWPSAILASTNLSPNVVHEPCPRHSLNWLRPTVAYLPVNTSGGTGRLDKIFGRDASYIQRNTTPVCACARMILSQTPMKTNQT